MAKKHQRWKPQKSNKLIRGNRGRARSSAKNIERKHYCYNERANKTSRGCWIREQKRSERNSWHNELAAELLDIEVAKFDPDLFLYKTNLVSYKDQLPKGGWFRFMKAETDPRVSDHYMWEEDIYSDILAADWDVYSEDEYSGYPWKEPDPSSERWRDMWVDGLVHDQQGQDVVSEYFGDPDYSWEDEEADLHFWYAEREEERQAELFNNVASDAVHNRNMERHKAGERYFRANKRTVLKPVWSGTPFQKKVA